VGVTLLAQSQQEASQAILPSPHFIPVAKTQDVFANGMDGQEGHEDHQYGEPIRERMARPCAVAPGTTWVIVKATREKALRRSDDLTEWPR
jgi:hypothetical protein